MNAPIDPSDDKLLKEYLERGSDISARYRDLPADDVPPELDAAILARATAAIRHGKSNVTTLSRWRRWSVPVTLAATFVLAISLVIKSNLPPMAIPQAEQTVVTVDLGMESAMRENAPAFEMDTPPPVRLETPPPMPQPPAAIASILEKENVAAEPVKQEVLAAKPAAREALADSNEAKRQADVSDPRAAARAAPAPAPTVAMSDSAAGATNPFQAIRAANEAERSQRARSETKEIEQREANPERWLDHIRQLRKDKKHEDADREWKNFRKRYPDYKVEHNDIATGN